MHNQERLQALLQTKKSTGEIITATMPHYRGTYLFNVYGRYSKAKENAYEYCMNVLHSIANNVLTYGITSANCFKFTFAAVFETDGVKYVYVSTASYDRVYLLEE